jgi:hypothetical protein
MNKPDKKKPQKNIEAAKPNQGKDVMSRGGSCLA